MREAPWSAAASCRFEQASLLAVPARRQIENAREQARWRKAAASCRTPNAYGATRNTTLLESVLLDVTTTTGPLVAPAGTVVLITELASTVNVAGVPLKVTLVAPFRLVPRILTVAPTLAKEVLSNVSVSGEDS
jgi:hypothetical protein